MIEKYFTLEYYLEIGSLILLAVIAILYIGLILLGKFASHWKSRQDRRAEKYWKEHGDECD